MISPVLGGGRVCQILLTKIHSVPSFAYAPRQNTKAEDSGLMAMFFEGPMAWITF